MPQSLVVRLPAKKKHLGICLVSVSVWSGNFKCDRSRSVKKYLIEQSDSEGDRFIRVLVTIL
jgi:hypothetical protein